MLLDHVTLNNTNNYNDTSGKSKCGTAVGAYERKIILHGWINAVLCALPMIQLQIFSKKYPEFQTNFTKSQSKNSTPVN